jgi:hypothetical protein
MKILALLTLFISFSSLANQCAVSVMPGVHTDGQRLSIEAEPSAPNKLAIGSDDSVAIHGQSLTLSADQKSAIHSYRQSIGEHVAKVNAFARDNSYFLVDMLDEIGEVIGDKQALTGLKQTLISYASETQVSEGEDMPTLASLDELFKRWTKQLVKAKDLFDEEFVTSVWDALSSKVKDTEGLNLSALSDMLTMLKERVEDRWNNHEQQVDDQQKQLCESLNQLIKQEQLLHEKIPELKGYQVFTI